MALRPPGFGCYDIGSGLECQMPSDPDAFLIDAERIRSVFQHLPLTAAVTMVNAALTAAVLSRVIVSPIPWIWLGGVVLVSVARFGLRALFIRRAPEGAACRPWAAAAVGSTLVNGLLWGCGAMAMFPAAETLHLFLAFVIGGMCAGATTVSAAHLASALAFILPASLPLGISFLAEGSGTSAVAAVMLLIFAVSLSYTTYQSHRAFGERIRLQLALARQRRELTDTSRRLLEEMEERKTIEQSLHQAQKMEAIGHLTGGLAHDFNNLLQVIVGNVNLIRRQAAGNGKVQAYAAAAEQAARRGAELTGSLLTYARRQSLQTAAVDVNRLLTEFEPLLLRTLGGTIDFEMNIEAPVPRCQADPAHFQSAILNLVINARDALPDGGKIIITSAAETLDASDLLDNPDAQPGLFAAVSVRDTGTGMTPDVLARVFEPFFTTKGVGKGSGLGLSQVFGFTRQSGGHIRLDSTPGNGTTATILLPAVTADHPPVTV